VRKKKKEGAGCVRGVRNEGRHCDGHREERKHGGRDMASPSLRQSKSMKNAQDEGRSQLRTV
jgi:hypothetical protein